MTLDIAELGRRTFDSMQRRGMHDPLPRHAEIYVRAHAETSEVFEAWIRRYQPPPEAIGGLIRIGAAPGGGQFLAEWRDPKGKPEGVAAELADVVLTCCYIAHRRGTAAEIPYEPEELTVRQGESVVTLIGHVHSSIAAQEIWLAIDWCFTIAARLGLDLRASIERKAAYNAQRPATECRL